MKDKIINWYATGSVGSSSKAMACAVVDLPNDKSYPHDPADFKRCLLFLKAVPEARQHFEKVAKMNAYWAAIIARFSDIEDSLISEIGADFSGDKAPITYALMREIIEPIEDNDSSIIRFGGMIIRSV